MVMVDVDAVVVVVEARAGAADDDDVAAAPDEAALDPQPDATTASAAIANTAHRG